MTPYSLHYFHVIFNFSLNVIVCYLIYCSLYFHSFQKWVANYSSLDIKNAQSTHIPLKSAKKCTFQWKAPAYIPYVLKRHRKTRYKKAPANHTWMILRNTSTKSTHNEKKEETSTGWYDTSAEPSIHQTNRRTLITAPWRACHKYLPLCNCCKQQQFFTDNRGGSICVRVWCRQSFNTGWVSIKTRSDSLCSVYCVCRLVLDTDSRSSCSVEQFMYCSYVIVDLWDIELGGMMFLYVDVLEFF